MNPATATDLPPQIACGALPDPSGLLASIISAPVEDTPRLVYADWLEEDDTPEPCPKCKGRGNRGVTWRLNFRGQEQIEKEPCPTCNNSGWVKGARGRRAELIRIMCADEPEFESEVWHRRRELCGDIWKVAGPLIGGHIARGFLSFLICSWDHWVKRGDELRAREWVPRVKFIDRPALGIRWVGKGFKTRAARTTRGRILVLPIIDGASNEQQHKADINRLFRADYPGTEFECP